MRKVFTAPNSNRNIREKCVEYSRTNSQNTTTMIMMLIRLAMKIFSASSRRPVTLIGRYSRNRMYMIRCSGAM